MKENIPTMEIISKKFTAKGALSIKEQLRFLLIFDSESISMSDTHP